MQNITVDAFLTRYLDETQRLLKSHYAVTSILGTVRAELGEKRLIELTGPDVYGYVQTRLRQGIKPATINHELSIISAAINHAVRKWGVNITNPVRHQWLKSGPLRLRYLEKHEAKTLLDHAYKLRPDLAAFIRLALNTGCRKTELLLLKWTDVDMDRRFILLRPENTKGNKRRILPLNAGAIQALKHQKQGNKTEWVFARQNGERVKTFNWLFRKACKEAAIEDFKIHDLRHTFASWLVSEGVELLKVRDLLGHSSIKMTERYAHLMPDRLLGAVTVLDLFASD